MCPNYGAVRKQSYFCIKDSFPIYFSVSSRGQNSMLHSHLLNRPPCKLACSLHLLPLLVNQFCNGAMPHSFSNGMTFWNYIFTIYNCKIFGFFPLRFLVLLFWKLLFHQCFLSFYKISINLPPPSLCGWRINYWSLLVFRGTASASPTLTSSEGRRQLQVQQEAQDRLLGHPRLAKEERKQCT